MTSPGTSTTPGGGSGLPGTFRQRLVAAAAALLAVAGAAYYAGVLPTDPTAPPGAVWYCTSADSSLIDTATMALHHPYAVFSRSTGAPLAVDSTTPADSALAHGGSLLIGAPCIARRRTAADTSAAALEADRVRDSTLFADSLKWAQGDTVTVTTNRDFLRVAGPAGYARPR